jgi:hypothetical protein
MKKTNNIRIRFKRPGEKEGVDGNEYLAFKMDNFPESSKGVVK